MMDDKKCAEICISVGRYLDAKLDCNDDAAAVLRMLVVALISDAPMSYREKWLTVLCEDLDLSLTPHQGMMH
jgi:hypothetical protein